MNPTGPPPAIRPRLPRRCVETCLRLHVSPTRFVLVVQAGPQRMRLFEKAAVQFRSARFPEYIFRRDYRISTSRFGIGQRADTNCTPLGLHRIAEKVGAGHPIGTVFRSRKAVGLTWDGEPKAPIAHRILWLDGFEPGWNQGGQVDTHARYIYIHGIGDELTLGRPASKGCIHLAAQDIIPLFDQIPAGTLVWIESGR
jgi:hypothetical protein